MTSLVKSISSLKRGKNGLGSNNGIKIIAADIASQANYWTLLKSVYMTMEALHVIITIAIIGFIQFFLGQFTLVKVAHGELPFQFTETKLSFLNLGIEMIHYWRFGVWGNDVMMNTSPGQSLFPRLSKCKYQLLFNFITFIISFN